MQQIITSESKPTSTMGNSKMDILSEHTLTLCLSRLEYPLRREKIADFRRFINTFIGAQNALFHNHKSETRYHYRYPSIQYKVMEGKAALMGINSGGVSAIKELLALPDFRERCIDWIGEQFAITEERTEMLTLSSTASQTYQLRNYIALNEKNLLKWHEKPGLVARASLLERCIVAHIHKFASAIQWQLPPKQLQVQVLDYKTQRTHEFDNPFIAFHVVFNTNITLPEGIGLGKAVSHGFGVLQTG